MECGNSAEEARKALGNLLRYREASHEIRLLPWLDSLGSDIVFGWRQLRKRPAVSIAAILSLALAIGATTGAFRLIHAVLLRTMPVTDPHQLFFAATTFVDRKGGADYRDAFDYSTFRRYSEAVADRADLMVAGNVSPRQAPVFGFGAEGERVYRQYVSGNLFPVFGLQPALGRLFTPDDDRVPGGHPVAVLSYDFWTRWFARDPNVLGSTCRRGNDIFTVIGVAPKGFTGTEPGWIAAVFLPAMMSDAVEHPDWHDFRVFVRPKPAFTVEQVRQPLQAAFTREHENRVKNFPADTPKPVIDAVLKEELRLLPAASGASEVQKDYRRPLVILATLVILVLLIACMNVANLFTAQAAARAREMALRVSIGAGRWRLIRFVLVESALLAAIASALGGFFASWSAPLVVAMLRAPEEPVRLVLDSGWLDLAFAAALATFVALLFGLAPALRASRVKPISALRGGEDPHARRRLIHVLLAAQLAFCILVQFVAGLFVSTFQRLSNRPLGFSPDHLLVIDADAPKEEPAQFWMQAADQFRATPGVESVALAGWPLLEGDRWTVLVRVPGHAVEIRSPYALEVSPSYFDTMRIGWIAGRDFRLTDLPPRLDESKRPLPGAGIVNEAFARTYFEGRNPVGRSIYVLQNKDTAVPMEIIGYVRDTVYADVREPMHAAIYVPIVQRHYFTFMVRTRGGAQPVTPMLMRAAADTFGLSPHTVQPESNFLRGQMLRERLLATLSFFFAMVALVLAAVGLYGVLNYSVTWQRREIGIRIALGARPADVIRRTTGGLLAMAAVGLLAGLAGGIACGRLAESMLFEIKATDPSTVIAPLLALIGAVLTATLPPAIRATRIDPAQTLRSE